MRVALVKRQSKSGYTYYADYRYDGRRVRKALGSNKSLAQAAIEKIERSLLLGDGPSMFEKRNITVKQLADEYISATASRRRPKTQYEEINRFEKSILPKLGHLRLCDVSQRHLEQWISEKMAEGLKPGSVNRHITSLKAMFKAAVEWEYIQKSPAARLKKLRDHERSIRFLEREEAESLLAAARQGPDYLYPIVLLALHTGMRRSEILHLRWQDFDFRREEIRIDNMEEHLTKSGRVRTVPMTATVREHFKTARGIGFVFAGLNGKPRHQLDKSFKSALRRAGISGFRFHDLRHTYASHLSMSGLPQRSLQELLGHGSGRMTERYSHLSPRYMHHAVKNFTLGVSSEPEESGHNLDTRQGSKIEQVGSVAAN